MQKIATRVFICASIAFGVLGMLMILTNATDAGPDPTSIQRVVSKLFMSTVFIILPSFALSVAGKYLNGKS